MVTQQLADPLQRTLAVIKLLNGQVSEVRTFSINPSSPSQPGVLVTSSRVLLDQLRIILYVATYYGAAGVPVLSTFSLTSHGDPDESDPLVTPHPSPSRALGP